MQRGAWLRNTVKIMSGVVISLCVMLSAAVLVFAKNAAAVDEVTNEMSVTTVNTEMAVFCAVAAVTVGLVVFLKRHITLFRSAV